MIELFNKFIELIGSFAGLLLGSEEFIELKRIISVISLIISILFLFYYFYLEKKYKLGTSIILTNLKNFLEAFIKKDILNKEWLKIKSVFLIDHYSAIKKVFDYLNQVISLYDYEGENLKEKFSKFPNSIFKNKNDFIKAIHIIEILNKEKNSQSITERESLAIIRVIEKGLIELLIIDPQAQWANSLILPED
ncbi:MAG: hypothetical protein KatS3mg094_407 [Candidatus Parcubacteria bacterium]|nr:MAG: hypothetical protein KatS3mg094_407 [Candidatus Parcubacteria bacterium]